MRSKEEWRREGKKDLLQFTHYGLSFYAATITLKEIIMYSLLYCHENLKILHLSQGQIKENCYE
jgi:hypothetical protein